MPVSTPDESPTVLMISRCVPRPHGDARRRQAWRLLRTAAENHQVHLLAIADAPVNLRDWSRLGEAAHRHALLPAGRPRIVESRMTRTLRLWDAAEPFDLVLCDMAALWPMARRIEALRHLDSTDPDAALAALTVPTISTVMRQAA